MLFAASGIEQVLFDISDALRVPVLVLTLIALAVVLVEFGALIGELLRRRGRSRAALESAIVETKTRLRSGDLVGATGTAAQVAWSKSMAQCVASIVELVPEPDAEPRVAKQLADFDYLCIKRLERSRVLVRLGPALGLMGTLIPLSPALAGLANGNVQALTDNLQVAFSVTVTGLLIGAVAFVISLTRDRLYGQDFSDAEYLASAVLGTPVPPGAQTRAQVAAAQAAQAQPVAAQQAAAAAPQPQPRSRNPADDPAAGGARHRAHTGSADGPRFAHASADPTPDASGNPRPVKVGSRARRHEDRGGDPLDGLVNLFDLGIVLSVAFLLAALASLDLTNVLTNDDAAQAAAAAAQVTVESGSERERARAVARRAGRRSRPPDRHRLRAGRWTHGDRARRRERRPGPR